MDRRDELLGSLDDDALHQLGDRVPAAWLDGSLGEGELQALVGTPEAVDLDAAGLHELLRGLDAEAESRVAAAVVDRFLEGGAPPAAASESSATGATPGFVDLDEERRAEVIPLHSGGGAQPRSSSAQRPWWSVALPLVAAAVVLLVLIDGPGLGAVFDDEGRVRPAEISPNATASAESGPSRAKWSLAEVPVPGSVAERSSAGSAEGEEEEEATISVPGGGAGGAPGAVRGGVAGGVVGGVLGGSLGGAPGGVAGGLKREPAGGGLPSDAVGSAQSETSPPKDSPTRRPTVMAIDAVMSHSLYAPDPDPKALAGTKAGMFDRRPCSARIRFCVDTQGRSVDVRSVGSCYDPKVNQICRDTVKKWRFKPFIVAGQASPVCAEVSFDLRFDKRR